MLRNNISATGLEIQLICMPTFPAGITINQFADDADPLDVPDMQLAEYAMDINGNLVFWKAPKPIEITLNLLPNTEADNNVSILADMNRVEKNKRSVDDDITMIVKYADGTTKILNGGLFVSYPPLTGASSGGRLKTKQLKLVFGHKTN